MEYTLPFLRKYEFGSFPPTPPCQSSTEALNPFVYWPSTYFYLSSHLSTSFSYVSPGVPLSRWEFIIDLHVKSTRVTPKTSFLNLYSEVLLWEVPSQRTVPYGGIVVSFVSHSQHCHRGLRECTKFVNDIKFEIKFMEYGQLSKLEVLSRLVIQQIINKRFTSLTPCFSDALDMS